MRRVLVLLLLGLALGAGAPREALLAEARRVMASARYCALLSTGADGRISARAMDPLPPDADFAIWLATNPASRKVRELAGSPRATLYYFDGKSGSYASLQGRIRRVQDRASLEAHWKEEWKPFYGDRWKDLVLLKFEPERLELSSPAEGLGPDKATWAPQSVAFPPGKTNE